MGFGVTLLHDLIDCVYLIFCILYLPPWWSDCICLSTLPRKYLRERNTQFWFKCFSTYKQFWKKKALESCTSREWPTWCILNFSPYINLHNCWNTLFIDSLLVRPWYPQLQLFVFQLHSRLCNLRRKEKQAFLKEK